jgi:YVTN family beta-propeller protein
MTTNVPVGIQNHNIILKPDQTRAWVTNNNEGTVSVVDTTTDKVIKTITVGVGPRHTFFSPDGLQAYVTNEFDDSISLIDTASMTAVATIKVGMMPHFPMVVGDRIFVTDFGGRAVTVVSRATRQVESTIGVGAGPLGAGATRDGARVYIACHNANNVAVIDAKELKVIAEIPTEPGPVQVTVTPRNLLM